MRMMPSHNCFRFPTNAARTVCLLIAAVMALTAGRVAAIGAEADSKPQRRTWTDKAGKFSVEATFIELRDGKVGLKRSDGQRVDVPLEKLSEVDVKYVHSLSDAQNPFGDSAIVHKDSSSQADSTAASAQSSSDVKTFHPNWKSVKAVRPATFSKWTFQPNSKLPTVDAKLPETAIALGDLPDSRKSQETILGLRVSEDGTRAIVVRESGSVQSKSRFVQDIDLVKGTCAEPVQLPPGTAYVDALPEQGLLLLRSDGFQFGANGTLMIGKLEGTQLTPISRWIPYENEKSAPDRDITHGWFLTADRVMTCNHMGEALTIWDTGSAKAVFSIPVDWTAMTSSADANLTFSPDRRLLAVKMKQGIAIIDLEAGVHVATLPANWVTVGNLAFSDDNHRLGSIHRGLTKWDLTTGIKSDEFKHTSMFGAESSKLQWAGDFLLVNSRRLYDAERGILLWDYRSDLDKWGSYSRQGSKSFFWDSFTASEAHGGRLWGVIVETDRPTQLISAQVPSDEAVKLDNQLPDRDKMLVMRPGDSVAIKLDIESSIASTDEVRAAIATNLTDAGFKVADNADLVVSGVCKHLPQQNIKVNMGFDREHPMAPKVEERTITPCLTTLDLKLHGEKIWGMGGLNQPGMAIYLQKDESLDQALDRLTKPGIDWVKSHKYEPYLTRPGKATDEGAYGTSQLPSVDKNGVPSSPKGSSGAPAKFGVNFRLLTARSCA